MLYPIRCHTVPFPCIGFLPVVVVCCCDAELLHCWADSIGPKRVFVPSLAAHTAGTDSANAQSFLLSNQVISNQGHHHCKISIVAEDYPHSWPHSACVASAPPTTGRIIADSSNFRRNGHFGLFQQHMQFPTQFPSMKGTWNTTLLPLQYWISHHMQHQQRCSPQFTL